MGLTMEVGEPLDGLEEDTESQREQEYAIEEGAENLRALPTEVKGICDEGERLCTESDDELGDEEGARDDDGRDEALFLSDLEAPHVELKSTTQNRLAWQ
ncbi:hypothetical protein CMUS01_12379 [Colletotrichum musicola]|uniref:Uncharacterized protein n=1 Tax=Colletotrichum musicola TaxID=2175873 RepID=A0A8H6JND1_9PEZI|nr:hypothetical protein CMUS01_12379 [Colletotrichum musicola]